MFVVFQICVGNNSGSTRLDREFLLPLHIDSFEMCVATETISVILTVNKDAPEISGIRYYPVLFLLSVGYPDIISIR